MKIVSQFYVLYFTILCIIFHNIMYYISQYYVLYFTIFHNINHINLTTALTILYVIDAISRSKATRNLIIKQVVKDSSLRLE